MLKTLVRLKELIKENEEKMAKREKRRLDLKWAEKQLKEMAKLRAKLILM